MGIVDVSGPIEPGVHDGSCGWVEAGLACQQCEDFENRAAERAGHPNPCSYTLKATAPERLEHYETRRPECGGFWPDVTDYLAHEHGLTRERVVELRDAPRDQDGWPIGMALTQVEYYMIQTTAPEDLHEKREEIAADDATDALVEMLKSFHGEDQGFSGADRGEDFVSFTHNGHRFTAQVEIDKDDL